MGRVLLVSFAGYPYTPSSLMPDNGLASLAGGLVAEGHEVRILDFGTLHTLRRLFPRSLSRRVRPLAEKLFVSSEDLGLVQKLRFLWSGTRLGWHQKREIGAIARDVAREAVEFRADIVGFKLWNGDGFSGSVRLAEEVRKQVPGAFILAGGPQVDYFTRHILDYTDAFDALLRGEGERVVPELVDAVCRGKNWRGLPGLLWEKEGEIQTSDPQALCRLDELPLPVYDPEVYPALAGDQKIKIGVLDESRGCPNRCAFCIHPKKSGGKWNVKSAERVVAEMKRLSRDLDTRYFIYSGSNTSARVALDIAEAIVDDGLDVRYGCFGHVRGIERADFDLLRRSGCEAIFYGLESGSERVLREAFNKPIDLERAEKVFQQTRQAGIRTITSIIFPAPFEDEKSRHQTMEFLRRVRPDSVPVTIPGVIPGTPWETEAERYGFETLDRDDLWEYALTYKIKLLFPPSLWKPLPYTLNGKSSRQIFGECEEFINELEEVGLVTNVPHELALMAHAIGESDLGAFRDRCRALFLGGDADAVADMILAINEGVSTSTATVPAGGGMLEAGRI